MPVFVPERQPRYLCAQRLYWLQRLVHLLLVRVRVPAKSRLVTESALKVDDSLNEDAAEGSKSPVVLAAAAVATAIVLAASPARGAEARPTVDVGAHDYYLETMKARGSLYNGYPNTPGYFGSFCLDGLAMAMHSVAMTTSFDAAIAHCVNLLGDADSTGAICGQIAGALYGYGAIHPRFKSDLHKWDDGQIALRAALLVTRPK